MSTLEVVACHRAFRHANPWSTLGSGLSCNRPVGKAAADVAPSSVLLQSPSSRPSSREQLLWFSVLSAASTPSPPAHALSAASRLCVLLVRRCLGPRRPCANQPRPSAAPASPVSGATDAMRKGSVARVYATALGHEGRRVASSVSTASTLRANREKEEGGERNTGEHRLERPCSDVQLFLLIKIRPRLSSLAAAVHYRRLVCFSLPSRWRQGKETLYTHRRKLYGACKYLAPILAKFDQQRTSAAMVRSATASFGVHCKLTMTSRARRAPFRRNPAHSGA